MPDRSSLPVCVACGIPAQHGPVYEFVVHELGDDPRIAEGLYHEDCIPIPRGASERPCAEDPDA